MGNCIIHPIPLHENELEKSHITYGHNFGQPLTVTGYTWYIEGADKKILVDSGHNSAYAWETRKKKVRDIQSIEEGLAKLGLKPGDIEILVLTHMHGDHIGQAKKLTNATVLVQRTELEFAQNPHPLMAWLYPRISFEGLKFKVIDGDYEICDGVSLLSTPGHAPGSQSVKIRTAKGTVVICGLCAIEENFSPPYPIDGEVVPSGFHTDLLKTYDSMMRVKANADIIIKMHDAKYRSMSTIP